jgi:hypothetical protein
LPIVMDVGIGAVCRHGHWVWCCCSSLHLRCPSSWDPVLVLVSLFHPTNRCSGAGARRRVVSDVGVSTHDPPCEQWLTVAGTGAGSMLLFWSCWGSHW